MKTERDIRNYISFAHNKGKEEGKAEGKAEGLREGRNLQTLNIARKLKEQGVEMGIIISSTGLTQEQIDAL